MEPNIKKYVPAMMAYRVKRIDTFKKLSKKTVKSFRSQHPRTDDSGQRLSSHFHQAATQWLSTPDYH